MDDFLLDQTLQAQTTITDMNNQKTMDRNMNSIFIHTKSAAIILIIFLTGSSMVDGAEMVTKYNRLEEVPVNTIQAEGWLKTFFDRQATGLGGNPQMSGYPFDTKMFQDVIATPPGHYGGSWWPYEQTGYYLDGIIRAGYLGGRQELIARGQANINWVLANPQANNILGPKGTSDWSRVVFFRAMMAEYEALGDRRILDAMSKHFLTKPRLFVVDRDILTLEPLLWLYSKTGNEKLLEMAVQSFGAITEISKPDEYGTASSDKPKDNHEKPKKPSLYQELLSDRIPSDHGVSWCERVKIPALLYLCTGNEDYLRASVKGLDKLIQYHVLVDGCPSSTEGLAGISPNSAHETCVISDLCWSLGYLIQATGNVKWADLIERNVFNAGLGALEKKFRAHQYYSSPNQAVLAEDTSHFNEDDWGRMTRLRMCYKPGHDTECCTGNIQRMMPTFAGRMWMRTPGNGIAAVLYGPSKTTQKVGPNGVDATITADTSYPFDESIAFTVKIGQKVEFPLWLRIPGWCSGATLSVNGQPVTERLETGTFFILKQEFNDGDKVVLNLSMKTVITRWGNKESGVAVERGPIAYSLAVKAREVKYVDKGLKGIWDYPCRFLYPDAAWNYALILNEENLDQSLTVQSQKTQGYVWDEPQTTIRVSARKVLNWKLDGTRHTPVWPTKMQLAEEMEQITLVPLGSTMLRMTVFPLLRDGKD